MRLTFDLTLSQGAEPSGPGHRRMGLDEISVAATSPRRLISLLTEARRERVTVIQDPRPAGVIEAGALLIAAALRCRALEVGGLEGARPRRRSRVAAHALGALLRAIPGDLWSIARLRRRAARVASRPVALPQGAIGARTVAYLRPQLTMRQRGVFAGGAAVHTLGVVGGFADNSVDVRAYLPEPLPELRDARVTPVAVRRIHHLAYYLSLTDYSTDVAAAAARDGAVDFVYQRHSLGSYAGLELARRLEAPLVLEYNGSEIWQMRNWAWGSSRVRFAETLARLERRVFLDASVVVVLSDPLREEVLAMGVAPERVLLNPDGVDVDGLEPLRARSPAQWRQALGQPEAPTIGFAGAFRFYKGVKLLPEIAAAVAAKRPDARWLLVGDGAARREVAERVHALGLDDRVTLTGVVPHAHALELMAACDACILPQIPNPDGSRVFSSPIKLFESMGLAKAVVASDIEQIGEVLDHERTGLLCPPGDVAAAAEAVLKLLEDEALRRSIGDAALAEATANYTWKTHTARILEALDAAGDGRRPSGPSGSQRAPARSASSPR